MPRLGEATGLEGGIGGGQAKGMSLSSAGKLTGAGKEANTVTQFAPENHLSGHSGGTGPRPVFRERLGKPLAWMARSRTRRSLREGFQGGFNDQGETFIRNRLCQKARHTLSHGLSKSLTINAEGKYR